MEFLQQVADFALASPWLVGVMLALAVVDALVPVVPSEALIIAAGVAAAAGDQNLVVVIAAAGLGSFVGETVGYLIGRRIGPSVSKRFADGGARAAAYEKITRLLTTRGGTILLAARFIPAGRTVATVTAGAMRFPVGRFLGYTAIGAPLGAAYTAALGYLGGAAFSNNTVVALLFSLGLATVVTIVVELGRRAVRTIRARRQGAPLVSGPLRSGTGSAASATAAAAASSARAASSLALATSSSVSLVSRVAVEGGSASVNARETPCSAEVTSLGMTQKVLPSPCAS